MPSPKRRTLTSRRLLSERQIVELIVGRPGPYGTTFTDHGERAVAADRLPEVMSDLSRLRRMRLDAAVDKIRRGLEWPLGLADRAVR